MFFPKPPNTSFPNKIPKIIPITAIQNGVVGGKVIVYKMQETNTASDTFLLYFFSKTHSVPTPAIVTIAKSANVLHPKKYIDANTIGIRDMMTVRIIFCLVKFFEKFSTNKITPPFF